MFTYPSLPIYVYCLYLAVIAAYNAAQQLRVVIAGSSSSDTGDDEAGLSDVILSRATFLLGLNPRADTVSSAVTRKRWQVGALHCSFGLWDVAGHWLACSSLP